MGVSVTAAADPERSEWCNWWNWRPTVELLRSSGIFDDEQMILFDLGVGEATEPQARAVAEFLESGVLPALDPGGRIRLDGTATSEPDDGAFHRDPAEQHLNYGAAEEWLRRLAGFCRTCGGFGVS